MQEHRHAESGCVNGAVRENPLDRSSRPADNAASPKENPLPPCTSREGACPTSHKPVPKPFAGAKLLERREAMPAHLRRTVIVLGAVVSLVTTLPLLARAQQPTQEPPPPWTQGRPADLATSPLRPHPSPPV